MKVLLLITAAILCGQQAMGTDNNFCKNNPLPAVQLKSFTVWDCSSNPGNKLRIKISSPKIPVCLKGDFHITGSNPGKFSVLYAAAVSGKIMGFIPYYKDLPLCNNPIGGKSCFMEVDCQKVKKLLGDPNPPAQNCLLNTGDVKFVVTTSIDGPINLPASVVSGLSGPKVDSQIEATDIHLPNHHVKIACVAEDMALELKA